MMQRSERIRWNSALILVLVLVAMSLSGCLQSGTSDTPLATLPTATTEIERQTESNSGEENTDDATEVTPAPTSTAAARSTDDAESEEATDSAEMRDPASISLTLEPVYSGHSLPVFVTQADDGSDRLFVVEKAGRILVYGPGETESELYLDISDRVNSRSNEQGLLGMAFAPNYPQSGHLFVNYTDANGDTQISRFRDDIAGAGGVDPDQERSILNVAQPASNHNAGMLAFGPDGYLYVGLGDGGRANDVFGNGQDLTTLLGSMLRIDVTNSTDEPYTIPSDNPFAGGDVDTNRPEIWGYGIRNPWRYSFDRQTGDLWMADVGQNQWEEVNRIAVEDLSRGPINFGWPQIEGLHCFNSNSCSAEGTHLPIVEYGHDQGCSVTGGYVYRGTSETALTGLYVYGDYCSGRIWLLQAEGENTEAALALESGLTISSFGEDEAGEIYLTDYSSGTIYRLRAE